LVGSSSLIRPFSSPPSSPPLNLFRLESSLAFSNEGEAGRLSVVMASGRVISVFDRLLMSGDVSECPGAIGGASGAELYKKVDNEQWELGAKVTIPI